MGLRSVAGGWVNDKKFIVVPDLKIFFLSDIAFWAHNEKELDKWCRENDCEHLGMTVKAKTDHAYFLFLLKWSS